MNIKMGLREMEWVVIDWINLAKERPIPGSCEHCNIHSGSVKFWGILE
jgi:hypothetical protein